MAVAEEVTLDELIAWCGKEAAKVQSMSLRPAMQRIAVSAKGYTQQNFVGQHTPDGVPWVPTKFRVRGAGKTLRDTGLLMAGVGSASKAASVEQIGDRSLEVGTNDERARTHQDGAEIKPKRGKFLAIPLTRKALLLSPRDFPGLHFRGGEDRGALFDRQGTAHYALVKRVLIPARPFIGWNGAMIEDAGMILADFLVTEIDGDAIGG